MKIVWTADQEKSTLTTTSAVMPILRSRCIPRAARRANTTATRLMTLAPMRIASETTRESSSFLASSLVRELSAPCVLR